MELPAHLQSLYRHWKNHLINGPSTGSPVGYFSDPALYENMAAFIKERLAIWERKQMAHGIIQNPPDHQSFSDGGTPYTLDPILSRYRFCNVFREFDKQTIAFHTLLNPLRDDFQIWLINMFMCRMIARTETIDAVGLLSFNQTANKKWMDRLIALPAPRYGNAYVFPISTIQRSGTPTRETFLAHHLAAVMPIIAKEIELWRERSVYDGVQSILPLFGFNHHFLWTEVLIDAAYQFPERIDLFKQFPIGPGSAPTMRRIDPHADPSILVAKLATCMIDTAVTIDGQPLRLSAENWEGIGCEFRKYTNLSAGHGRKRLYTPS